MPTRLIVRDALLNDAVTKLIDNPNTDMPYTEVKTEVVIDRLTSQATPRQLERIPAGSEFEFEMVYNVYKKQDVNWLKQVFVGMVLLEGDFLGGQGSRGSGQIRFGKFKRDEETNEPKFDEEPQEMIKLEWRSADDYLSGKKDKTHVGKFLVTKWKETIEQSEVINNIKLKCGI
jgi:CRISPR-associated protein Csm3